MQWLSLTPESKRRAHPVDGLTMSVALPVARSMMSFELIPGLLNRLKTYALSPRVTEIGAEALDPVALYSGLCESRS
jgi:hypothetical protein